MSDFVNQVNDNGTLYDIWDKRFGEGASAFDGYYDGNWEDYNPSLGHTEMAVQLLNFLKQVVPIDGQKHSFIFKCTNVNFLGYILVVCAQRVSIQPHVGDFEAGSYVTMWCNTASASPKQTFTYTNHLSASPSWDASVYATGTKMYKHTISLTGQNVSLKFLSAQSTISPGSVSPDPSTMAYVGYISVGAVVDIDYNNIVNAVIMYGNISIFVRDSNDGTISKISVSASDYTDTVTAL